MVENLKHICRKCGKKLSKPPTGRPRKWCSVGCRRGVEYEIKRLNRHIGRLEEQREGHRGARRDSIFGGVKDFQGRTRAQRWKAIDDGIVAAEKRLAALLEATE